IRLCQRAVGANDRCRHEIRREPWRCLAVGGCAMVAVFDEESAVNRVTLGPSCPCCRMARAWWPAGMASGGSAVPDGPAPSFLDEVAKQPSAHALAGDENKRDLFEHVDADRWVVIRGATVLPM